MARRRKGTQRESCRMSFGLGFRCTDLSESGFAGLEDLQDSAGERVRDRRALVGARIGGIFGCGEKREVRETES